MKIRKAVIPVAGLGTRFLPATKSIPKELLTVVDKPILLYVVEEVLAAGMEEVIFITGRGKAAIEDFFDVSYELEDLLNKKGKPDLLESLTRARQKLRFVSVRQGEALGLGHAVLCAESAVGREPFALLLGDEIMISKPAAPSAVAQLARAFETQKNSIVAVMQVQDSEVGKYGIVDAEASGENLWSVHGVVEKPSLEKAPSRLALPGRYVFDAEIFNCLREVTPGRGGEIQLTDGMTLLAKRKGLKAMTVDAERFDAGDKFGFLQANVELGLRHPELGPKLREYLQNKFGGHR